jgi:hypothetical protein
MKGQLTIICYVFNRYNGNKLMISIMEKYYASFLLIWYTQEYFILERLLLFGMVIVSPSVDTYDLDVSLSLPTAI